MELTRTESTVKRLENEIGIRVKSETQRSVLVEIIEDDSVDTHSRSTEICDYFGIERRGNRNNIRKILAEHESDN
jgi:hypothetical protein